jgi:hypothetical protein
MSKLVEEKDQPSSSTDEANKFFLGARSALKIGDMGAAERLLRRSLDLSPKNYLYMLTLARLLVQMEKNFPESEFLLLESSNLKMDAVEPRLILSAVYEKQGRLKNTQAILKSVINIDPANFIAKRKLSQLSGEVLESQDSIKMREEVFAQVLEVDNADLPLITASTIVVSNSLTSSGDNLGQVDDIAQEIKENLLEENSLSKVEGVYIGLSERLALAELLALDSAKPPLENHVETVNEEFNNSLNSSNILGTSDSISEENQALTSTEEPLQMSLEEPSTLIENDYTNNQDIWSSKSEDTVIEILRLEADYLLAIVRDFFYAVKEQLDEATAFLLLRRAKQQIELLYPELDYFEIYEDHRIIEFLGGDRFVSKRTLEAITTWMYLLMILLKETSYLRDKARDMALEKAFPKRDDIEEERLFRQYFNEIQL